MGTHSTRVRYLLANVALETFTEKPDQPILTNPNLIGKETELKAKDEDGDVRDIFLGKSIGKCGVSDDSIP